jgi:hypothetical protein
MHTCMYAMRNVCFIVQSAIGELCLRYMRICMLVLAGALLAPLEPLLAQDTGRSEQTAATVTGTVIDVNGDTVVNATVVLEGPSGEDRQSVTTGENGSYEFASLKPGVPYRMTISAEGFSGWASPPITLTPGQFKIITDSRLAIAEARTTIDVHYSPVEVATEQVKQEEQQRVFGFIPNFYVVYDRDPAPMTTKLKFQMAWKVSHDPVTIGGIFFISAVDQAGDRPNFRQGWEGYGQRVGANAADGFTDIMIGGAILPSLLHQDPRYHYQGEGTTKSRAIHAMLNPFVAKGDNGKWQPNYSSIGGDLASSAISNLYYPQSNRGTGLIFENFALSTAERVVSSLTQEFVLRKLTRTKEVK